MSDQHLIRNAIRCNKCGDEIESTYRHDFRSCKCGAVFVDGGLDYQRVGGDRNDWTDLSVRDTKKPHLGKITDWQKSEVSAQYGLGYQIVGIFVDHPRFAGMRGHTSYVVAHDEETGEIETRNSRYTLVQP